MTKEISPLDKKKFEEIKKQLVLIGFKESAFIRVELLFYEAITIAREYGDELETNALLTSLKELEAGQYQSTKLYFKKSSQREQMIKRFMNQFKIILSSAIKNAYFQQKELF